MRSCEMCFAQIPEGSKICFDCWSKLDEEQSESRLAAMTARSKSRPGASYHLGDFSTPWSRHKNCNHCWPFDCRCC